MVILRRADNSATRLIELSEWQQIGPTQDPRLKGCTLDARARVLVDKLRGQLDIRELRDGIEISSNSFVGRIDVGPLQIAVTPKLPALPLFRLLRYAYGLRDLTAFEETLSPITRHGLHDLLIALLVGEVEELLHRGLARRYVPRSEKLESPRGRILVERIIRDGGLREARLPCRHFERSADWHLNQVLCAGLQLSGMMTQDFDLRRRVHLVSDMFGDVQPFSGLTSNDVDRAERELTRMTDASRSALTIIRLLQDMLGTAFDSQQRSNSTLGFLFDMNVFFQRLLSRFLRENLTTAAIVDEKAIRNLFAYGVDANPRKRSAPTPRPDYALSNGNKLTGYLDAKYRDVWSRGLPAEWLYQLSIYALASPQLVSVLLYASMDQDARDERLEVRQPVAHSGACLASVVIRPVSLPHMAALIDPDRAYKVSAERRRFADDLVVLSARLGPRARNSIELRSA